MSEQKSVSPLLDGFTVGTPVNDHFGVCCYPAVKENSERKYIVKAISIPASQKQLDALLITGAYKDPADAADYFHTLSDEVVQEAEFLKAMSRLEGFIPYEGCQVEPMRASRIGYEVYLLSGFRLSLERYMHRNTVTHLEAVNLGIDLCAALAACRRAGKLYIDLKPSNVFISTKKEYKIGDLGFVPMDSLKFTSMPAKYRSCYTAPELMDDLSVLNGTADTYALGMILYQIFNNGVLPDDPAALLPAPCSADKEMAAILMKACARNPEDRWEDPAQMGQALVDYMQSVTVNDTPIMPPITGSTLGRTGAEYATTKFPTPQPAETEAAKEAAEADTPEETPAENAEEAPVKEDEAPAEMKDEHADAETTEENIAVPAAEETEAEEASEDADEPTVEAEPQTEVPENPELPKSVAELSFQPSDADDQETAQEIEAATAQEFAELTGTAVQENIFEPTIDDAHLDSELKELHQILKPAKAAPKAATKREENITPVVIKPEKKKKSVVGVLFTILLICLLLAGSVWGYMFYTTAYIQTVNDIQVSGTLDRLTVTVDSKLPDGTLTAVCSDPYGNSSSAHVRGGKAEFSQLTPGTFYTISLETSGLHKLEGPTSAHYTTESVTSVAAFTAAVGNEDGTAVLNLIVEGHMPDQWKVLYTAEGEPELGQTFSGNTTTIEALIVGKTYTFRLENGTGDPVNGNNTTQLKASRVINTKNVNIISCVDGDLTVTWDSDLPEEAESWIVHCFGEDYDQSVEVQAMQASFSGLAADKSYTVEVHAKGMGTGERDTITANPITLTNFQVDDSNPMELTITWDFLGTAPENGWKIQYTLDNSDLPFASKATGTSVTVAPKIPGAVYHFTFQADEVSVLNRQQTYVCPVPDGYSGHGIRSTNLSVAMLSTPDGYWSYNTVGSSMDKTTFAPGESISLIIGCNIGFYLDAGELNLMYVFRDANGNVLGELVTEETVDWHEFWNRNDCRHTERTLEAAPTKLGDYTLDIYFDGMPAASTAFTIG